MKKWGIIVATLLAGLSLTGLNTSNAYAKHESTVQSTKKSTNKLIHFKGKTIITPKGTIELKNLGIYKSYDDDGKATGNSDLFIGLQVTNKSKKSLSPDKIFGSDLNISIDAFQNTNSENVDLANSSDDSIGTTTFDNNEGASSDAIKATNAFDDKILPGKSAYKLYTDCFQLKNLNKPIKIKLTVAGQPAVKADGVDSTQNSYKIKPTTILKNQPTFVDMVSGQSTTN